MRDFRIGFIAALLIAGVFMCSQPRAERRAPAAACTIGQAPGRAGR